MQQDRERQHLILHLTTINLVVLVAVGCASDSPATATPSPATEAPSAAVDEPLATETHAPSVTPSGTLTADAPTETPFVEPTAAATPTPAPDSPPGDAAAGESWLRPIDGMAMIYFPAGEFELGSSETELDAAVELCERDRGQGRCDRAWFYDEAPQHGVSVDAFWLDSTEVTNAQYAVFLNQQGNQIEGDVRWLDVNDESSLIEQIDDQFQPKTGYDDHPVIEVSWYGALAYCKWAGGWLPSEDKWEYAARGPERREFPWGSELPSCELANVAGCQDGVLPVGSLPDGATEMGLQDMAGNVFEWVTNWSKAYPGTEYDNPEFGTTFKIVRGGSWSFEPYYTRSAHRAYALMPDVRDDFVGFRCLISPEE